MHKLRFLDDYIQSCNEKQNLEGCEETAKNMINGMFVNLKLWDDIFNKIIIMAGNL